MYLFPKNNNKLTAWGQLIQQKEMEPAGAHVLWHGSPPTSANSDSHMLSPHLQVLVLEIRPMALDPLQLLPRNLAAHDSLACKLQNEQVVPKGNWSILIKSDPDPHLEIRNTLDTQTTPTRENPTTGIHSKGEVACQKKGKKEAWL